MEKKKYLLPFMILLLIVPFFCMAASYPVTSTADAGLLYLPRSVVNNRSFAINLMGETKSLSSVDVTFSSDSPNSLALFRIYDTLNNLHPDIISKWTDARDCKAASCSVFDNSVNLTIVSSGYFVNENNPSAVIPYDLNVLFTEQYIGADFSRYVNEHASYSHGANYPMNLSPNDSYDHVGTSQAEVRFTKNGNNVYSLYLPSSPAVCLANTSYHTYRIYQMYRRIYDICITLPETIDSVEPGYYYTTLTITSNPFVNREYYEFDESTLKWRHHNYDQSVSETITIWGYVGTEYAPSDSSFNYIVYASDDTYSMNLGISEQTDAYKVASLSFNCMDSGSSVPSNTNNVKYKVYISPTSDWTNGSGEYMFKKIGTEAVPERTHKNTIWYDLYLNLDGDSNYESFSYLENQSDSYYSGFAPGIMTGGAGTHLGKSYYIYPSYSLHSETFVNSSYNNYIENWNLNNVDIYLKLTPESLANYNEHAAGLYSSDVYFTLVVY